MDFIRSTAMIQNDQYDCRILCHPKFQVIEKIIEHLKQDKNTVVELNLKLSELLLTIPMIDRSRVTEKWVTDYLASFKPGPVICSHSDLLFEPHLNIDPLALFRQAARITRLVVLWLGDFTENELYYAIPEHNHYRVWRMSNFIAYQPKVMLHRIA